MRFIDLTGQKFGKWTVVEKRRNPSGGSTMWLCKCECGTEQVVRGKDLRKGKTTQCEHCARKAPKPYVPIDMAGRHFGKWTVVDRVRRNEIWLCRCDCGRMRQVTRSDLESGKSTQCIHCGGNGYKHGMRRTRLYKIWANMLSRCKNPNERCYKHYGGRGVVVCDEWNDSAQFVKWAQENGYNDNLTIERIDNNGNYEPSNCTWIRPERQSYNRRNNHHVTINGKTKLLVEWAQESGVSYSLIIHRIKRGWPPNLWLSTPDPHRLKRIGHADSGTKNASA